MILRTPIQDLIQLNATHETLAILVALLAAQFGTVVFATIANGSISGGIGHLSGGRWSYLHHAAHRLVTWRAALNYPQQKQQDFFIWLSQAELLRHGRPGARLNLPCLGGLTAIQGDFSTNAAPSFFRAHPEITKAYSPGNLHVYRLR